MRKFYLIAAVAVIIIAAVGGLFASWYIDREQSEQLHYEREETELIISNLSGVPIHLFKAGKDLQGATEITTFDGHRIWLPPGNYFLRVDQAGGSFFYPVPIIGYQGGPDENGAFVVTIRSAPSEFPPRLLSPLSEFVYIPSGHFLLGDRLNLHEPHYVWLTGFFMSPFEVTNEEFREFLNDSDGYADDSNWTETGRRWKARNSSEATARLKPTDTEFKRFGQPDQPVVLVNWFEANAFCRWLTRKMGKGQWLFGLPTDAEWEKAARGPDSFDYALGMSISDNEVPLYNWTKNPGAKVTVVGFQDSQSAYTPNRYGLYHMSGNVAEWTQSLYRPSNKQRPYVDDDRNRDDQVGLRVLRGGSWYSASIAILYIPYRETFQPEVSTPYLGFRIVARPLP